MSTSLFFYRQGIFENAFAVDEDIFHVDKWCDAYRKSSNWSSPQITPHPSMWLYLFASLLMFYRAKKAKAVINYRKFACPLKIILLFLYFEELVY